MLKKRKYGNDIWIDERMFAHVCAGNKVLEHDYVTCVPSGTVKARNKAPGGNVSQHPKAN